MNEHTHDELQARRERARRRFEEHKRALRAAEKPKRRADFSDFSKRLYRAGEDLERYIRTTHADFKIAHTSADYFVRHYADRLMKIAVDTNDSRAQMIDALTQMMIDLDTLLRHLQSKASTVEVTDQLDILPHVFDFIEREVIELSVVRETTKSILFTRDTYFLAQEVHVDYSVESKEIAQCSIDHTLVDSSVVETTRDAMRTAMFKRFDNVVSIELEGCTMNDWIKECLDVMRETRREEMRYNQEI